MNKKLLMPIVLLALISLAVFVYAGLDGFSGITEVKKVTSSHPDYDEISKQYSLDAYDAYELTYHINKGWNFLPYAILNGRDAVTGKASCWKQDDQRGNIQATILEYVYMYEPDISVLPENHVDYYVGGKTEDWDVQPLYDYKRSIWGIPEPNSELTLPINWVYSPVDCDFIFYTGWLDTDNYKETENAIKENLVDLKLEKGWQVVLQLFPGFSWNEIKGDCIIEKVNFWDSASQSYVVSSEQSEQYLNNFMSAKVEIKDYFKPVMMKVRDSCTLQYNL